ncbi:MAG: hypothetical protein H6582_06475 [Crocinitomicaceae bacterium]|nr:hypothetical protein [Crocinitomicaceae bacterium]
MRYGLYTIFLLISVLFSVSSLAQEDTTKTKPTKMLVIKNDGAQYVGYILSDDGREILMETESVGKLYIPKHLIKSISVYEATTSQEEIKETKDPEEEKNEISYEDWKTKFEEDKPEYQNYTSTKYIQSDNAYPLRKGESFIKFMPMGYEAQIPITKNWSAGAIGTYLGAPFGLKTKFSIPINDSTYLGWDINYGSMVFATWFGVDQRNGGGYTSLTFTFGNRQRNFSFKAGYALIHQYNEIWMWDDPMGTEPTFTGGMEYSHFTFLNFGSMLKLTDRMSIVMDFIAAYGQIQAWGSNFNTVVAAGSVAARFGPKPNHRFQLGGTLFATSDFFVPVPVPNISYTYIFPKRNP